MPDSPGYEALRRSAAVLEHPTRARVRVTGKHRLELLHRMTTQDLRSLPSGEGRTAVLLTDKAKVVDHLIVYALDGELRILSARSDAAPSLLHLQRYTLRDDFVSEDQTAATCLLRILGPRAVEVLASAGLADASALPELGVRALPGDGSFLLATDGPCARNLALWVPSGEAEAWKSRLLEAGGKAGLQPATEEDYEIARVESGYPSYGAELSEEVNPLEAGLGSSVNWQKGCYIGQEVVARLDTYQKIQRHLVGLRLSSADNPPPAGSKLLLEGKPVGWVTSAVHSPELDEPVALGYVKTAHSETGTSLRLQAGETLLDARVADLPLVA